MTHVHLGIDVGSTTVKVVALDARRRLLAWRYRRSRGQPRRTLLASIEDLASEVDLSRIAGVGLTGSGGAPMAEVIGGYHVNELIAQTRAVGAFYPQARTVIEIGGQDSKFLALEWDATDDKMVLVDFAMNNLCAAGTGSFLDQQAERLGISIEEDFARLALQSEHPARIAGRCTVFAKSDMIHWQQKGTPLPDIIAGLALALARNFKSVIGKGKAFTPPILFQGGVAYNEGVARAFETVLKLEPGELIIPEHRQLMAALGTAFVMMDELAEGRAYPFQGFASLEEAVATRQTAHKSLTPLPETPAAPAQPQRALPETGQPLPVYLGVDVGSITTKVVLIDAHMQVVARRYLYTEGRPLDAVQRALLEIAGEVGDRVFVRGVGTTGSGRHLTAEFVGGDVVRSEITAQARATVALDPTVDTVFEIGGQDSKYISLDNGAVVNFAMNTACAAGTGSFLEEQASKLEIDIARDFGPLAFSSEAPAQLGERCTVFMESDLVHYQQRGAELEDLTAGLAYAIVENYLKRVVGTRPIGHNIFFQGGVAWNPSVVAAFQARIGRKITVPPHHDVTGAIGAAILALEEMREMKPRGEKQTRFQGFDLRDRTYNSSTFVCRACPNLCEINRVVFEDEAPLFYGARCDKYDRQQGRQGRVVQREIPDLYAERQELLFGDYTAPNGRHKGRLRVGLPRTLFFFDMFPYWRTFFAAMDMEVVISEMTNPRIAASTKEHAVVEACYPAKLVYGHVLDLLGHGNGHGGEGHGGTPASTPIDILFLPSIIDRENIAPGQEENKYCPYIPAMSQLVPETLALRGNGLRVVNTPLQYLEKPFKLQNLKQLARDLGVPYRRVREADDLALDVQEQFYASLRRRGREVLAQLGDDDWAAVIVGRPYNTADLGVNQDLPYKLRKLGILPLPMDYLPLESINTAKRYPEMFWRSGQDILAAGYLIRQDPRLHAIYLNNFICGPDSFILNYFRRIMRGEPFLELEIDDHTGDAGLVTRCEAFFESLRMGRHAIA